MANRKKPRSPAPHNPLDYLDRPPREFFPPVWEPSNKPGMIRTLASIPSPGTRTTERVQGLTAWFDDLKHKNIDAFKVGTLLLWAFFLSQTEAIRRQDYEIWQKWDERKKRVLRDLPPLLDEVQELADPLGDLRPAAAALKELLFTAVDLYWTPDKFKDLMARGEASAALYDLTMPKRNTRGEFRRSRRGNPGKEWLKEVRESLRELGVTHAEDRDDLLRLSGILKKTRHTDPQ